MIHSHLSLAIHFLHTHTTTLKEKTQRLGGISENKFDIILIENIAFIYLLINYFSLDHQVSPSKHHSLMKLITFVIDPTKPPSLIKLVAFVIN